jgi:hypothetical protein
MKSFFKSLAEWALTMWAVCNKHEATGNQYKLRVVVIPHNEWVTMLNLVQAERQKHMDQLEYVTKRPFSEEEEQTYTYCQHLKGILKRIEKAFKPI